MAAIAKLISAGVQPNNRLYRNAQTFCGRLPRRGVNRAAEGSQRGDPRR